jgi:hypothetical protein
MAFELFKGHFFYPIYENVIIMKNLLCVHSIFGFLFVNSKPKFHINVKELKESLEDVNRFLC